MCGLPGVALVDARGADDGKPAQHMPRGGAEGSHREALCLWAQRSLDRAGSPLPRQVRRPNTDLLSYPRYWAHLAIPLLFDHALVISTLTKKRSGLAVLTGLLFGRERIY